MKLPKKLYVCQTCNTYSFKCLSHKSIYQLPWQQGFHDSKYYQILLLPQGTYALNIRFVCHQQQTYKGISLLPWIQGFHSYKLHNLLMLPKWTTPPNLKFIHLQTAMLQQYASVAMVTRYRINLYHHGSFLLSATFVINIKLIAFQMLKL